MELRQQYVISLKIICRSKRWKDLLLRNKFEETVFFGNILADLYLYFFISNPLRELLKAMGSCIGNSSPKAVPLCTQPSLKCNLKIAMNAK